jgi:hypothetical protein
MSRDYHCAVGVSVIALMNDFFRSYFKHVDSGVATYVPAELDLAFLRYWQNAYREHNEGSVPCAQCADFQDCTTGDALSVLRPNPITGVSERFHRHIFSIGTFDLVSRHGEIFLERIRS